MEILEFIPEAKVDLIAGCPPCQGFSKLTDKYQREDKRNKLIREMYRLILELRPTMVMMENVPGLASKGIEELNLFVSQLESVGYEINWKVLHLADYGVPQSRKRLVLLAGIGFKPNLPLATHSKVAKKGTAAWLTLKDAWADFGNPIKLSRALNNGGPEKYNWHVVRDISQTNISRYKSLKPGEMNRSLPENLKANCHKAMTRGFGNQYTRMSWQETPPTITGGFATPSKGRFGLPHRLRAMSPREAANLQTFPNDYIFKGEHIEPVCEMIGNALPIIFAKYISKHCIKLLGTKT